MKPKNLVAEVLMCIFAVTSFVIYAGAIMADNKLVAYLSVLVYIIPQLITTINEFTSSYINLRQSKLSIITIVIGIIVIITSLVLMSLNYTPSSSIRFLLVLLSSIFTNRPIYSMAIEIGKYYSIHKMIAEDAEV